MALSNAVAALRLPHSALRAVSSFLSSSSSSSSPSSADLSIRSISTSPSLLDDAASSLPPIPSHARVVIAGAGVVGSSVAYHLALRGWTDVVLLDQGQISCGTTHHSVGLLGILKPTLTESRIAQKSIDLYNQLDAQGYHCGLKHCGSVQLASTDDRMIVFKRLVDNARAHGIDCTLLSPREVEKVHPLFSDGSVRVNDLKGGIWIPGDHVGTAPDICNALARAARDKGVRVFENCRLNRVNTTLTSNDQPRVSSVDTSRGNITCEYFVNCGGIWGRELGKKSDPKVKVPLQACEHYYLVTKPIGIDPMLPVIRDPDGYVYVREWRGGLMVGGFEPVAKPAFPDDIPDKFEFQLLPNDWDHFHLLLEQMLHRLPCLADAEVKQLVNGPESFTPDGKYILGESPEIINYFVAAGMHSTGITGAGGCGEVMADWIIDGAPASDLWSFDVQRFVGLHNNRMFLSERVKETLGLSYAIRYPDLQFESSRELLRTSPLYTRLEVEGARFGEVWGFERALFFDRSEVEEGYDVMAPPAKPTFGMPHWFDMVKEEYRNCRQGVSLIDMSSFTKVELKSRGREVVDYLQYMCSNNVDAPNGTVIHTGMQNERGGYENDCSVVRLAENHFFIIAPTTLQTRMMAWLNRHKPSDGSVVISDVTSMYTALNVIGPKAHELLQEVTDMPLDRKNFSSMTAKEINVAYASGIKALRLTHTGEDGWVLYIPSEFSLHVYDRLMTHGQNYGIRNGGYYALRSLRIEKFFLYWGQDIDSGSTPYECGREHRVKFNKDFIGKQALLKQKEIGVQKKFLQLILKDHDKYSDPWPFKGEPIFRNGKFAGVVTSGAFGYSLDSQVLMGYVMDIDPATGEKRFMKDNSFVNGKDANWEVQIAGKKFQAKASTYPIALPPAAPSHMYVYKPTPTSEAKAKAKQ